VSLADAKAAFDSKSAVFVDVRDVDVYDTNHIQGALNIPLAVFDAQYTQLDRNQWIITYCT
jgi:rhodanese-related sulfurtransferase